jgi:hypothetical protein
MKMRPEKRVRFNCKEPTPTKVCSECGWRAIPIRQQQNSRLLRTMHKCYQCGALECSHCVRVLTPIVCELCRISYIMLGQYMCT